MKVVVQILESGQYCDQIWEGPFLSVKGELREVTPSYAVQLIEQAKAALYLDPDGKMKLATR